MRALSSVRSSCCQAHQGIGARLRGHCSLQLRLQSVQLLCRSALAARRLGLLCLQGSSCWQTAHAQTRALCGRAATSGRTSVPMAARAATAACRYLTSGTVASSCGATVCCMHEASAWSPPRRGHQQQSQGAPRPHRRGRSALWAAAPLVGDAPGHLQTTVARQLLAPLGSRSVVGWQRPARAWLDRSWPHTAQQHPSRCAAPQRLLVADGIAVAQRARPLLHAGCSTGQLGPARQAARPGQLPRGRRQPVLPGVRHAGRPAQGSLLCTCGLVPGGTFVPVPHLAVPTALGRALIAPSVPRRRNSLVWGDPGCPASPAQPLHCRAKPALAHQGGAEPAAPCILQAHPHRCQLLAQTLPAEQASCPAAHWAGSD